MFESLEQRTAWLAEVATRLRAWAVTPLGEVEVPGEAPSAADRVDVLRAVQELSATLAAVQLREQAAFTAARVAEQAAAGVPARRQGAGVPAEIGLACRISANAAAVQSQLGSVLIREMPATFAELAAGRTSERRVFTVAKETLFLSLADRRAADAAIAPKLESLGDRGVEAEIRRIGYALDPKGFVDRSSHAAKDRRVSLRPAPDTMTWLSALLPVEQGVAVWASLVKAADTAKAAGDPRTRGQVLADTLVGRVIRRPQSADQNPDDLGGQSEPVITAEQAGEVPVEICLVLTDRTLLGETDDEPAYLDGYGPVPGPWARDLALRTSTAEGSGLGQGDGEDNNEATGAPRWLRRLVTSPDSGQLAGMETRRRLFTDAQRRFLRLRDQHCRMPWCDAPIRHADHITPAADGGQTSVQNGQGVSANCNYSKQASGWTMTPGVDEQGRHTVTITTPTGHTYTSRAPDLPGTPTVPEAEPDEGRPHPTMVLGSEWYPTAA